MSTEIRIGSSDIAAICGLTPQWRTPLQVWAEKTGKLEKPAQNNAMWLGTALEPVIGAYWSRESGLEVQPNTKMFRLAPEEWAVAIPDFFYQAGSDICVLECKHRNWFSRTILEEGKAPDADVVQVMWQLGVMGFQRGELAALVDKDLYRVPIEYNYGLFTALLEAAARFREFCLTDTPPEVMAQDVEVLKRLHTLRDESIVELPVEAEILFQNYERTRQERLHLENQAKQCAEVEDKIKADLLLKIGNASVGRVGNYEIRVKTSERKGFEVKPSTQTKITIKQLEAKDGTKTTGAN